MKKIEFGFSNNSVPIGPWEGIGIRPGLLLTDATYFASIVHGDNKMIVIKIEHDQFGHYPELVGKFMVLDSLVDLYPDGSNILYLNQIQSISAQTIENYLNIERISKQIKTPTDIPTYLNNVVLAFDKVSRLIEMDDKLIATSITDEAFQAKKEAISKCHNSFSYYGAQIIEKEKKYWNANAY